jgi:LacI family transcriptional regulator
MAAVRKKKTVITIKDLARICGVSRGTVDRALNNRGGINEETRRLILETAETYNYIKNQSAAALSAGKSPLLGVILFSLDNEFFSTIVSSIEKNARKFGYSVLVMLSGYDRAPRSSVRSGLCR